MMVQRLFMVLVVFVFLSTSVISQSLSDVEEALSTEDYQTAATLLKPLAEQGNSSAQFRLGTMYAIGQGVEQDYEYAAKYFRLAAEQGNAQAQFGLGLRYLDGLGVPQDYELAHMWFNLASALGYEAGATYRDGVASKMSQSQIARAQLLSRQCFASGYKICM